MSSSTPIPFSQWQLMIKRALRYLPWKRRDSGSVREHAAPIIDLFASIVMRDEQMSETDVDSALDFLRYSFPDAEHAWLAHYFQKATESMHPVSQLAVIAGTNRNLASRMAMALEVLALLRNARDERAITTLFDEVTIGLMLPGASSVLKKYLDNPFLDPPDPIISIRFDTTEEADVKLGDENAEYAFRVLHCDDLILLINDGPSSLRVRGKSLPPQSIIPLSSGHVIGLNGNTISHSDLLVFLNAKKTGIKETFYLFLEEGSLAVQRNKTRASILRITFGLKAELELVRPAKVTMGDMPLTLGKKEIANYNNFIVINNVGPFYLGQLQNRTEDLGKRYYVDPAQRTVKVSNIPARISAGDLLLTRGLAASVFFEVTFSHNSKTGILTAVECDEPLQINERIVRGTTELHDGDLIRISLNQSLRCRFIAGILEEERNVIHELLVDSLSHEFNPGNRILDNIDFSVHRGEMVCILGPSGSGKSTLLSCLAGHMEPLHGTVKYNGLRLYSWLDKLVPLIAHIPREDILNPYLTVKEHIAQAMTIRRPRLSRLEKTRRVNSLLKYLGLTQLANRRVGASSDKHLSDGERTRLNLGLDMGGIADVFLIDEPISGLSSRDSENVIETLENISREKIVIVTLHRPSSHLLHRFHKALLLDHGGQVAFWGTPSEMLKYFRHSAKDLGIIVSPDSDSAGGADYVFEVLESPLIWQDRTQKNSRLWQERFENYSFRGQLGHNIPADMGSLTRDTAHTNIPNKPPRGLKQLFRIFSVWFKRTISTRIRSKTNLYTALLEGPIMAFLVAFPLRSVSGDTYLFEDSLHISPYLFLSVVAAMFFGLMAGATEILRDKSLLLRERNAQIFFSGYMLAKALVLTFIATIQCMLYLLVGNLLLEIYYLFIPYLIIMVLTSFVGISASLFISLILKTERAALNAVPLLLIPQILFAGAIIPFEEMNHFIITSPRHDKETGILKAGRVPYIAELCPLRYSYESLLVTQATNNRYDSTRRQLQIKVDELKRNSQNLTKDEVRHLRLLLQALSTIPSLEAPNAKEADYALRRLSESALRNDPNTFLNFIDTFSATHKNAENYPLTTFFVSKRLASQFDYAEALRMNREQEDRPEIYLSANKPIPFTHNNTDKDDPSYTADKNTISTPLYNNLHLFLIGLIALIISGNILRRKMSMARK